MLPSTLALHDESFMTSPSICTCMTNAEILRQPAAKGWPSCSQGGWLHVYCVQRHKDAHAKECCTAPRPASSFPVEPRRRAASVEMPWQAPMSLAHSVRKKHATYSGGVHSACHNLMQGPSRARLVARLGAAVFWAPGLWVGGHVAWPPCATARGLQENSVGTDSGRRVCSTSWHCCSTAWESQIGTEHRARALSRLVQCTVHSRRTVTRAQVRIHLSCF